MKALSRNELAMLLVWAFHEQNVETSTDAHIDALTLYNNVMALPLSEAATVVTHARTGNVPPADPVALARWIKGLTLLRDMLQQPMCDLSVIETHQGRASSHAA